MPQPSTSARPHARRVKHSDRLLSVLSGYEHMLVVSHDTPDPDSIASGWAVWRLIRERLGRTARFVGRGAILRAENRHMVELLGPPLQMVAELDLPPGTGAVLVDCSPQAGNHLLENRPEALVAVIDHHGVARRGRRRLPFEDIRPGALASASIAASYLREQQIDPGPELATALLYGIRTESRSAETSYSWLDRSATLWLSGCADFSLLSEIEDAPLSPNYFRDLVLALESATVYGETGFCLLPRADYPEIVGEVADLLIRGEGIRRVLCVAAAGRDFCVSVRTVAEDENAAALVHETLAGLGHGGGHQHRAGGKIPGLPGSDEYLDGIPQELLARWLRACNARDLPPRRLVARDEIARNL